jgi:hypothetical protein
LTARQVSAGLDHACSVDAGSAAAARDAGDTAAMNDTAITRATPREGAGGARTAA